MANADALFLALGLVAFAADCAVQYAGYQRYLGAELRAPDPALREAALRRWIRFYLIVESMVVIVVLAALAGVLAAVVPGRRAAKLDVLKAVVSD